MRQVLEGKQDLTERIDIDLAHSNRKLEEIKERWDDLLRKLNFDYGNLS